MSAARFTKLFRTSLAGAVLLILAFLLLSVTRVRAETVKGQAVATSLAEVTLEPGVKLLVILENGEKIKGKAVDISDGALSVSTRDGIRTHSESEIFQITQAKGLSRGKGALIGAGIGAVPALVTANGLAGTKRAKAEYTLMYLTITAPLFIAPGAVIGALGSGEEKRLVYQNPTIAYHGRRIAFSLAEVSLERGAKLLVVLGNGERIKGRARRITDGTLSVSIKDGSRILSESEISQIYMAKGTSRAKGAIAGALIGTLGTIPVANSTKSPGITFVITAASFIPIGAVIGALVSGEKHGLFYQNPTNSTGIHDPAGANVLLNLTHRDYSPHDFKTSLINFRDGQLSFGAPSIYLQPNRFDGFRVRPFDKKTLIKKIDLVSVDF